jgi:hypothetical protein
MQNQSEEFKKILDCRIGETSLLKVFEVIKTHNIYIL